MKHGMHRATIFRKVNRFRQIYGVHPDVFELPGVTIDLRTYWAEAPRVNAEVEAARKRLSEEKS